MRCSIEHSMECPIGVFDGTFDGVFDGMGSSISDLSRHRQRHVHRAGGRAGIQKDLFGEAFILSTSTPIPAQWTCRRRCRDKADIEPPEAFSMAGVDGLFGEVFD